MKIRVWWTRLDIKSFHAISKRNYLPEIPLGSLEVEVYFSFLHLLDACSRLMPLNLDSAWTCHHRDSDVTTTILPREMFTRPRSRVRPSPPWRTSTTTTKLARSVWLRKHQLLFLFTPFLLRYLPHPVKFINCGTMTCRMKSRMRQKSRSATDHSNHGPIFGSKLQSRWWIRPSLRDNLEAFLRPMIMESIFIERERDFFFSSSSSSSPISRPALANRHEELT